MFFLLLKYKTYFLYFTLFVNLKVNGFIDVKKRLELILNNILFDFLVFNKGIKYIMKFKDMIRFCFRIFKGKPKSSFHINIKKELFFYFSLLKLIQ